MKAQIRSILVATCLAIGLLAAGPASAATSGASITAADTYRYCYAGTDGTCSATVSATKAGAFNASSSLDSPNSPFTRSSRQALSLGRFTVSFDLHEPTPEALIEARINLASAAASWEQNGLALFDSTTDPRSKAQVLFQLLGQTSPTGCGCGWTSQAGATVALQADSPGQSVTLSDEEVVVRLRATNRGTADELPAGRYEVLLRAYALADFVGGTEWGSMQARMNGTIGQITVSTPDATPTSIATTLSLAVEGAGQNRTLIATLADEDGATLAGQPISFYGDGALLGTRSTDVTGRATLTVGGKLRGGSRVFSAVFEGADPYEASSAETRS